MLDQDFEYFTDFCSLVDYKLMKTVNDDTISDPKPRMKKKARDIRKREDLDEEAGPSAPKPKKEYKIEKVKKRKENSDRNPAEEERPAEEPKNLKFNRKTGKFQEKPKFQKKGGKDRFEKGGKFQKKPDRKNQKHGKPEWRD